MSSEWSVWSRDRPILDERQNAALSRDHDECFWEAEHWQYGAMDVWLSAFRHDASLVEQDLLVAAIGGGRVRPSASISELRWCLKVQGSLPDDHFFDWFEERCRRIGPAVVLLPHGEPQVHEPEVDLVTRANEMMSSTRPPWRALVPIEAGPPAVADHDFGAALVELRLGLSWEAAQYVYAVAADVSDPYFVVMPYDRTSEYALEDAYLSAHHATRVALGDGARQGACAAAVASVTAHPDPVVDRLLRGDPTLLREHLIERGDPLDPLLAGIAGDDLALVDRLADSAEIRNELVAFWELVVACEPRLRPRAESTLRHPRFTWTNG